jgi:hypothetical protein
MIFELEVHFNESLRSTLRPDSSSKWVQFSHARDRFAEAQGLTFYR